MRHLIKYRLAGIFVIIAIMLTGPYAWAEPGGTPTAMPADEWSVVGFGNPLSGNDLGGQNGRKDITIDQSTNIDIGDVDIHLTDAKVGGYLTGNFMVEGSTNGANIITEGAFAGTSGIATVIQNSGNQVILQTQTILDVTMK
jgi:hypothetical protein